MPNLICFDLLFLSICKLSNLMSRLILIPELFPMNLGIRDCGLKQGKIILIFCRLIALRFCR